MFCQDCQYHNDCKDICPPLKQYLSSAGIKSANWIRPRISSKKRKDEGLGEWREIPSGLLRQGLDQDYAGDIT